MRLQVHEIDGLLYQTFKPTKNYNVEAIRPHIYKHGSPTGSLKLQILDSQNEIVAESTEVPISSISDATYFHGYVRFYINVHLKNDVEYRLVVMGTGGYSFSESAYCGACNDFDLQTLDRNYTAISNGDSSLDFQIWSRQ